MGRHINIALFVPHLGCPHQCSFCNQKSISGCVTQTNEEDVRNAVETALSSSDCETAQIAFFGGSFTAIDREYMISLLSAAYAYVRNGSVKGIRISTRPDCIDSEVLSILKEYGVTAIELGCQSMDDSVLTNNKRGHTAEDVRKASALIREYGFELGHQMMTGLYTSTPEKDIYTAREIIKIHPDTVRIYPTVILENTENAERYRNGEYIPQTLEEAIASCSKLLRMFSQAGIPVIRLGLHSGGNVEDGYLAGVYHPAFREMCESRIYLENITEKLKNIPKGKIEIAVSSRYVSMMNGQKKENIKKLHALGYDVKTKQREDMSKYEIEIRKLPE